MRNRRITENFSGRKIKPGSELYKRSIQAEKRREGFSDRQDSKD